MLSFLIVQSYVMLSVDNLICYAECPHYAEFCKPECLEADLLC